MKVHLDVFLGSLAGKQYDFTEADIFLFGRSPDCHCCLPDDPTISRHHFMLEITLTRCRIRDLGSLNGNYVNDVRYGGREEGEGPEEAAKRCRMVDLQNGDCIQAGETQFRLLIDLTDAEKQTRVCIDCGKEIEQSNDPDGQHLCGQCREKKLVAQKNDAIPIEGLRADPIKEIVNVYGETKQGLPHISGYLVVLKLGQGGFGTVYFAKRLRDGKELALKTLTPLNKSVTERDVKHFQREIQVSMELKHPNIVSFDDQGCEGRLIYFAMEYCSGGSVQDLVEKRGILKLDEALPVLQQALEGLSYAHEKGYVHRDLKPANILFTDRTYSVAKVSDFGMAKSFQGAGLSGLTVAGEYAGTIEFIPKEQLLNYKNVKPVSDVFSIAAAFYFMLTGKYVYDFEHVNDPLKAILEDRIIPISERTNVPKKVADVLQKALRPEPEERYQIATEMKKALAEITLNR